MIRLWFLDVWKLIVLSVFLPSVLVSGLAMALQPPVFYCVRDSVYMKLSVLGPYLYECRVSCWRDFVQLATGTEVDPSLMNQILVTDCKHKNSSIN